MAYTKTTWTGKMLPAAVATGLDNIETGVDAAHDAIDATGLQSTLESKASVAESDELLTRDSVDSNKVKKVQWSTAFAAIWTKLGALIAGGTEKTTPVDADTIPLCDSAASSATKKLTWANLVAKIFTDRSASTGVQDATKFPKATAAEIAALLTSGGYSIAPATGSDNLDNIADGATYKRIAAAVATALNASNGAFLIEPGKVMIDNAADDWNNFIAAGFYDVEYTPGDGVNAPITGAMYGNLISFTPSSASAVRTQMFFGISPRRHFVRTWNGSSWESWEEIFTGYSSGNGGQPPAPKPTTGTPAGGANGVGQVIKGTVTAGNILYHSGGSDLTGTWDCRYTAEDDATGFFNYYTRFIGAGGIGAVPAGVTYWFETTRIS